MLYSLSGKVIHGKGLGHRHHMPTANIKLNEDDVKCGVYAGITTVNNKQYYSVTNIGPRPSIDNDPTNKVETYIINFNEDIYGKDIKLDLYYYLRDIRKYNDIDEVVKQADIDIKEAEDKLKEIIKL